MSRIGRQPISIPEKVKLDIKNQTVKVEGPLGSLALELPEVLNLKTETNKLLISPSREDKKARALWGLWRSLLANAVFGVEHGFEKKLEMVGLGFKAGKEGQNLQLSVGFSHQVIFKVPQGIETEVEKNIITVSGIDKQLVGEVAASIRRIKPPEPYKGKGIKYIDEIVRRKAGKAAKTAGSK